MRRKPQNARLYKTALSPGLPQGSPRLGRSPSPQGSPPPGPSWAKPCFSGLKFINLTPLNNDSRKVQYSEQPQRVNSQICPSPSLPPAPPFQNRWCPHFKNCSAGPGFSRFPDSVSLKRKNEALACPTPLINAV